MSYLNVPRPYFAGEFIADPSPINDSPRDFALGYRPADFRHSTLSR